MIHVKPLHESSRLPVTLATRVHRDLEVGRLDHVPQGAPWLVAAVEEAARIAGVSSAAVNLIKSTTQRTLAMVGGEATVLDRRFAMCGAVVDAGRRVHVADASLDERWADNPFVDGRWGRVRFYGAHPLLSPSGFAVGTLCVFDDRPRELDAAQVAELDALADRLAAELEQTRLDALRAGLRSLSNSGHR